MSYPQDPQQGGYPQSGGYPYGQQQPGWHPQPPRKSNTALIVSIVAVVVLILGTLGITGFVAPGFFLSDDESGSGDESSQAGGHSGQPSPVVDPSGDPLELAAAIVAGLNNKDANALTGFACPDADDDVASTISQISSVQSAELVEDSYAVMDGQASVDATVVGDNGSASTTLIMAAQDGTWCWSGVSTDNDTDTTQAEPTETERAGAESAAPVIDDFVSKVNSGDAAGATALACQGDRASIGSTVAEVIANNGKVKAGPPEGFSTSASSQLTGTLNGQDASGLLQLNSGVDDTNWCVFQFVFS